MDLYLDKVLAAKANLGRIRDSLMEGITAHDEQRRILYFRREAERLTGYTRNEVVGLDCHKVFGGHFCGPAALFAAGLPAPGSR